MRVAILGDYPLDQQRIRGGVQAAFSSLMNGLIRIDNLDIHILTYKPRGCEKTEPFKANGATVHLLSTLPRFERLRNYRTLHSVFDQELAEIQPDLLHAQEAAAGAYVALRSGCPVVVTAHGIRGEDYKFAKSWLRKLRLYFDSVITERAVMRQVRYLISISDYITHYFSPLFRTDIEVYDVPNAVDERFFHLPDCPHGPVVLYTGRVTSLKRVKILVQAFARVVCAMPTAQLRIAGECRSEAAYVESIWRFIHQAGLGQNVYLLGELSQEEILHEMSECSLLALSSAQENTPMAVAQALAAGKPVVATRVGGVAGMVGEGGERGLLVNRGEVEALSSAILCLLQDLPLNKHIGQAGRQFAWDHYHPDRVARQTAAVYQRILDREGKNHV